MSTFTLAQTESVIYNFKSGNDGANPASSLIADSAGNLYGTTASGGNSANCGKQNGKNLGCGTVFELTPPGNGVTHWTETVLYAFQGGATDGKNPSEALAFDSAGNLYGTTGSGGTSGQGTIFQLQPPAQPGGAWTQTMLYNFSHGTPSSGLVPDGAGNFYGETFLPEVYELSPPAVQGGAWTVTVIETFPHGGAPVGGLAMDKGGNLYGTSSTAGTGRGCHFSGECGFAFELVKPTIGTTWNLKVLYNFTGDNGDGATPSGGVVFHGNNLYGTSAYGGNDLGDGTVFELSPGGQGQPWTETTIYEFDRSIGGFRPEAGVVFDHNGNLYSDLYFGNNGGGEIFELTPPAQSGNPWTLTDLFDTACGVDACYTVTGLIFDKSNTLYGTTAYGGKGLFGVVFSVTP